MGIKAKLLAVVFVALALTISGCTQQRIIISSTLTPLPTNSIETEDGVTPSPSPSILPSTETPISTGENATYNEVAGENKDNACMNEFDFKYNMTKIYSFNQSNYRGEIDLNSDGICDKIEFNFDYNGSEPHHELKINNIISKDFIFYHNIDIYTVDLDTSDSYKEIVIVENGMDAFSSYGFYRYTGDSIIELGVLRDTYYYGNILFDCNGKFIPYINRIDGITPVVISGYYEIVGSEFIFKEIDADVSINKDYVFSCDTQIHFEESEQIPTSSSAYGDNLESIDMKKGEKLIINQLGISTDSSYTQSRLMWANVVLEDGRKGNIYLNDSVFY